MVQLTIAKDKSVLYVKRQSMHAFSFLYRGKSPLISIGKYLESLMGEPARPSMGVASEERAFQELLKLRDGRKGLLESSA